MGPTKMVWPIGTARCRRPPFVTAANELLDQLYDETERLVLQKMTAIHYVAKALIERDELIGDELEEVFQEAEAMDPTLVNPYERKLLQFRTFSPRPEPHVAGDWSRRKRRPRRRSAAGRSRGAADGDWPEPPEEWLGDPLNRLGAARSVARGLTRRAGARGCGTGLEPAVGVQPVEPERARVGDEHHPERRRRAAARPGGRPTLLVAGVEVDRVGSAT